MRLSDERGAVTSLTIALLTPVFVVLAFGAVQAALWSHARTEARVVARDTATLVARADASASAARSSAADVLSADTDLDSIRVEISERSDLVVVRVTGRAPGIVRGTSLHVDVSEAVPREGVRP